ncbi:hypothetical protein ACOMHN_022610 [Nucella lapillus]
MLTNGSLLLWEHVVYRDRLLNEAHRSNMHRNSVGCKVLYTLTRYAWMTAFFWMLVEGFHLYRLISRAFQTPVTIWHYYAFGWDDSIRVSDRTKVVPPSHQPRVTAPGSADPPSIKQAAISCRLLTQSEAITWLINGRSFSCWVQNAGALEWIIYGPELMCILSNVFFFIFILRILVTEIQSHPNEPSNYRRALRATFLLVPLFGLQLFLVSYNPWPSLTSEIMAKLLSHSQGAVVAIIFCFSNSEVHCQLRHTFSTTRCRQYPHTLDIRSITVSTHMGTGGGGEDAVTPSGVATPCPRAPPRAPVAITGPGPDNTLGQAAWIRRRGGQTTSLYTPGPTTITTLASTWPEEWEGEEGGG